MVLITVVMILFLYLLLVKNNYLPEIPHQLCIVVQIFWQVTWIDGEWMSLQKSIACRSNFTLTWVKVVCIHFDLFRGWCLTRWR